MLKNHGSLGLCLFILSFFASAVAETVPCIYHAQYGQDAYVYEHFFKDVRNGIFVDVGAHDGISLSNTYFFEKSLGWHGICIEPLQSVFEKLIQNRSCTCIQGCIAAHTGTGEFLEITGYSEMLSGLLEKYEQRHFERVRKELARSGAARIIEVPCFTFNDIMTEHGITHIDYLSIDTEGGEYEIVASIDLDKITIDIIDVEVNFPDQTEIKKYLMRHGYRFVTRLVGDEIYARIVE